MVTIAASMALALCFLSIALVFVAAKSKIVGRRTIVRPTLRNKDDFPLHPLNLLRDEENRPKSQRLKSRDER
ncbi:hypothetical protein SAMN04515695_3827 [Pseudovibrio sp. Tun.PSC04-5.I4]|nr:hypothetical protein SAMN04515695_3827 [Pseudovibrio sp. Tun.PSC04-5.I4]